MQYISSLYIIMFAIFHLYTSVFSLKMKKSVFLHKCQQLFENNSLKVHEEFLQRHYKVLNLFNINQAISYVNKKYKISKKLYRNGLWTGLSLLTLLKLNQWSLA